MASPFSFKPKYNMALIALIIGTLGCILAVISLILVSQDRKKPVTDFGPTSSTAMQVISKTDQQAAKFSLNYPASTDMNKMRTALLKHGFDPNPQGDEVTWSYPVISREELLFEDQDKFRIIGKLFEYDFNKTELLNLQEIGEFICWVFELEEAQKGEKIKKV